MYVYIVRESSSRTVASGLSWQTRLSSIRRLETSFLHGYSLQGGAVGGGVQWIGVVSYSKIVYNNIGIITTCFHCTPLCRMQIAGGWQWPSVNTPYRRVSLSTPNPG